MISKEVRNISFQDTTAAAKRNKHIEIIELLKRWPTGLTDTEIANCTQQRVHLATARRNELAKLGKVVEAGTRINPVTKKQNTVWAIPESEQGKLFSGAPAKTRLQKKLERLEARFFAETPGTPEQRKLVWDFLKHNIK